MPRSYVPQIRVRQPRAPLGVVGGQAANPYRMHRANGLENGIANAAAALFRAPQERAAIEASREQNAQAAKYRADRDAKNDLFRESESAQRHADHQESLKAQQAHWDAEDRRAGAGGHGGPRMAPIPAFVTTRDEFGHVTGQRPLNADEVSGALENQGRITRYGQIDSGANPTNGKPLSAANPYRIPMNPQIEQEDELFRQAQIEHGHGVAPAADPAQALFGEAPDGDGPDAEGAGDMDAGGLDPHPDITDPVTGVRAGPEHHAALDAIMGQVQQKVSAMHQQDQAEFREMMQNASADYLSGDPARAQGAQQRLMAAAQRLGISVPDPSAGGQTAPAMAGAPAAAAPRRMLGVGMMDDGGGQ